ncbi:MAG: STAS/SEC14 domain-containing protein [Pedobacter sp.]|nr:MAG: STAS/SEC14 domain-containing protein [Pedobacter sp.]
MLQKIEDLPAHVFGVKAIGEVTKDDIEHVLLPGLQQQVDSYDEINYLLVLETDVQEWTAGAWLQDMKAGIKHFTKWKKIAVVTDQKAVEVFTDVFSIATPGEAKGFKPGELEQAKVWVATP